MLFFSSASLSDAANGGKAKASAEALSSPSFRFLLRLKQSQLVDALWADLLANQQAFSLRFRFA
jgi:hypothetical protein